ncbi:hypothetical protein FQR65_LT06013 [Abscondita terminalis]|nr:hypothetical protein FQR65_LT06013 [Abscondita terminalis]
MYLGADFLKLNNYDLKMNVRELPEELQLKAISELNENPTRVKQDVEDLRTWLKHQVHLQFKNDFKDVPLSAYLKWDLNLTKKVFTILNGYPIRIKYIIAVNADPVIEKIYNILKIAMSKKIQKKVILLNKQNSDKVFEVVPRDLIPKEFG